MDRWVLQTAGCLSIILGAFLAWSVNPAAMLASNGATACFQHAQAAEASPEPAPGTTREDSSIDKNTAQGINAGVSGEKNLTNTEPDMAIPEQPSFPGAITRDLQKGGDGAPLIHLYYPEFSKGEVDKSILDFIKNAAAAYESDIGEFGKDEEKPANYESWEMDGFFSISRPNPDVASITFNIYSYSGGAHGNLLIRCLNYDLATQRLLEFADIFEDPQKALDIMSKISSKELLKELGEDAEEDMIQSGTSPEIDNFSNLSLRASGVLIEFQPYQVGPWAIGPQHVEIPLEDLAEAGPSVKIWPRAAANPPAPSGEAAP